MSIRLRRVDGQLVALCAARSVEKPGDIYIDDEVHYALAQKFALDNDLWETDEHRTRIEAEESENPNRAEWDQTFGRGRAFVTESELEPT